MNKHNDCNAAPCYGVERTAFDRMMQAKYSPMCQPSAQILCDAQGNPALNSKGRMVEAYTAHRKIRQQRQLALARARVRARAISKNRRAISRNRRAREGFEAPPPPPKKNGKRKKAVMLTKDWCGYCKKIKGETDQIRKLLDQIDMDLVIAPDGDVDKHMEEHRDKGATGFPSTLIVDENDKVLDVVGGYRPAKDFAQACKEVVEKYHRR
jgi:hypothetical protein